MFTLCRMNDLIEQIISHFGGQGELARKLGIKSMAITNWKNRKVIPPKRAYQIEKMSEGEFKAASIIDMSESRQEVA